MKVKQFKPLGSKVKTPKAKLSKAGKINKLIKLAMYATK